MATLLLLIGPVLGKYVYNTIMDTHLSYRICVTGSCALAQLLRAFVLKKMTLRVLWKVNLDNLIIKVTREGGRGWIRM